MEDDEITAKILKAITHAPDWLREELKAKDSAVRLRAEETLAAMVAAALKLDS